MAPRTNNIEVILNAAENVVLRRGITSLTFDSVAEEARMSKGGILYHFPTKDKLIFALVERTAAQWRKRFREAYERSAAGPGRMVRGLVDFCLEDEEYWSSGIRSFTSATFAALAQDQKLIEPMRSAYAELYELLERDELPPGVSESILLAMDGLWLNWVLGLTAVDKDRVARVKQALSNILLQAGAAPARDGSR